MDYIINVTEAARNHLARLDDVERKHRREAIRAGLDEAESTGEYLKFGSNYRLIRLEDGYLVVYRELTPVELELAGNSADRGYVIFDIINECSLPSEVSK